MSAGRKGAWPRRLTAMAAAGAMISSCGGEGESAPPGASGAEATGAPAQQLYWVDRQGVVGAAAGPPQALITSPALSPDGARVVVRARDRPDDRDDIWVHDVADGTKTRVTRHAADDKMPTWSPAGDRIAFYSYRNGLSDLYVRAADGGGEDEPLVLTEGTHEYGPSWSPDGRTVAFHRHDPETDTRALMYVTVGASGQVREFLPGEASIAMPEFAPDGRYLAYVSNESGEFDVYVRAFPDGRESVKVSRDGGMWPKWSGDSSELFFYDGTHIAVVSVRSDPFEVSGPRRLFDVSEVGMESTIWDAFNPLYDVADDGRRFVVVRNAMTP